MVKGILQQYYGHFPEQIPDELWLHAGLLGDGFSGECDRMGGDKNLQVEFFRVIVLFVSLCLFRGPL